MVKSVVVISPPGERPAIDADDRRLLPEEATGEGWSHVIIHPPAPAGGPPPPGPDIGASLRDRVGEAARRRLADAMRKVFDPPPPPPDIGASFTDNVALTTNYYLAVLAEALADAPPVAPARRYTFAQGLPEGVDAYDIGAVAERRSEIGFDELETLAQGEPDSGVRILILRRP